MWFGLASGRPGQTRLADFFHASQLYSAVMCCVWSRHV